MADAAAAQGTRNQRRLRNLLIDRRFQLKYVAYIAGIAAVLSIALGLMLWRTSSALVTESRRSVEQGQQIVSLGRQIAEESRKVSAVVEMNIVKDPEYSDDPELRAVFEGESSKQNSVLAKQQKALEEQAAALSRQSAELATGQRTMLATLLAVLSLLVVGVGLAGIVVTHKVAGPVFKMTRQIRTVASGDWSPPDPLRKGDELIEFHRSFEDMVGVLRQQRAAHIALLDSALEALEGQTEPSDLEPLQQLRNDMSRAIEA